MAATRHVRLLARHFFWRFFDNDFVSPDSDARHAASLAVAFVATPGILVSGVLFLKYGNPWLEPPRRLTLALSDKLEFISWSMMVMVVAVILSWDTLALDARDYAILGPLPIRHRTLLAGKLCAVAAFVAVFAVAVNLVPMTLFPLAFLSSSRLPLSVGFWVMTGHAVACLGAAVFAFLAVLAIRGLLLTSLGPRMFRRVSLPAQFLVALVAITGCASLSVSALDGPGLGLQLAPPLWFLGLYETVMRGGVVATLSPAVQHLSGLSDLDLVSRLTYLRYSAAFGSLAALAVRALAVSAVLAMALYFAGQFRQAGELRHAATVPVGSRRLAGALGWLARRAIVRDPIAQAGFFFTLKTLARSARHRLYVAGYFLVGCVLSYTTIVSVAAAQGADAFNGQTANALTIQLVLSFFLIVGLRVVFTFPAELRASWIFRLLAVGEVSVKRYLAGVRRAVAWGVVVPFFLALLPAHAALWGPRLAALHFTLGVLWALALVEVLLLGLVKLPFSCAHVPGKGNLKVFGGAYVLGFLGYAYGFAAVEREALRTPAAGVVLAGALLVGLVALGIYRDRRLSGRTAFVFDELPDPAVVTLGL